MSDAGYTVDYVGLADLAQKLVDLRGELERGTGALDPLLGAVGDDELRHRLREFADNWSDKKGDITKQLDAVAGFAREAADVYRQTDEELKKGYQSSPGDPAPSTPGGR